MVAVHETAHFYSADLLGFEPSYSISFFEGLFSLGNSAMGAVTVTGEVSLNEFLIISVSGPLFAFLFSLMVLYLAIQSENVPLIIIGGFWTFHQLAYTFVEPVVGLGYTIPFLTYLPFLSGVIWVLFCVSRAKS